MNLGNVVDLFAVDRIRHQDYFLKFYSILRRDKQDRPETVYVLEVLE